MDEINISEGEPETKRLKLCHNETETEIQEGTQEYSLDGNELNLDIDTLKGETAPSLENGHSEKSVNNLDNIAEKGEGLEEKAGPADPPKPLTFNKIESVQRDAFTISTIIPDADVNELYQKILKSRHVKNRIEVVTNDVLENISDTPKDAGSSNQNDNLGEVLFNEVTKILEKQPDVDPSLVYNHLENLKEDPERVEKVLAIVKGKGKDVVDSGTGTPSTGSFSSQNKAPENPLNNPEFKKNPLYRDLKTLVKVLPAVSANELYAYLEAHYNKPNRVQIVIDELTKSDSQESLPLSQEPSLEDLGRGKGPQTVEDKLIADLKELKEIFRDCDPNFLYEKLLSVPDDGERVNNIATELFENKNYPKLKEVLETNKKDEEKRRITEMRFDLKEFLMKFPEPSEYFNNIERPVNQNYQDHVTVYMKNTYPQLKAGFIKKVLEENKAHLLPAVLDIENYLPHMRDGGGQNKLRTRVRDEHLVFPEVPDEPFFQELLYYQHMDEINSYLQEKKDRHKAKVDAARENKELMECGCCFDDECLFEDMAPCEDGHLFCKECIGRSVEAAVGEGRTKFQCLTGSCELCFPIKVLQEVLTPSMFSLALRKMQEEEIRQADIPDLVACPFCTFATIMPDENDKVFKCLNPECLRESCRLCQEPNHVPLRCDEVEKASVTSLRTYIETKVSESMLRTCPNCKKRFFKQYGCNKMTCTCGTTMCYICRESDIDYNHFDNNQRCQIDSEVREVHEEEMKVAADKAIDTYKKDHPDFDVNSVDVDEIIKTILDNKTGTVAMYAGGGDDEYYDDEDDDGDDY